MCREQSSEHLAAVKGRRSRHAARSRLPLPPRLPRRSNGWLVSAMPPGDELEAWPEAGDCDGLFIRTVAVSSDGNCTTVEGFTFYQVPPTRAWLPAGCLGAAQLGWTCGLLQAGCSAACESCYRI